MRRRTFLIASATAACGVVGWRLLTSSDEDAVIKVVYKRLGYLRLDDDGVHRFAADLRARNVISKFRLRVIDAAGPLYTGHALSPDSRLAHALHHGEDRVTTQYLISTDFLVNGCDKQRIVKYLGYYDPMVPCNNPFARSVQAIQTA